MLKFIYQMREKYDYVISKNIKRYINTAKQQERIKLGIEFITTCLDNEKLPNFTRINLHSNDIDKNNKFVQNTRKEITNKVLRSKMKAKKTKIIELKKLQNALFDLESEDWNKLQQLVEEKTSFNRKYYSSKKARRIKNRCKFQR